MKEFITHSQHETQALAQKIGQALSSGLILLLVGDLGAGKTTFVQGLAKGLNVSEKVNSPTFVIMKEYEGRLPLIHIDAYRLEGISQDLGFEDYAEDEVVKVIEWPQYYFDDLSQYDVLRINRIDDNTRQLCFEFKENSKLKEILSC